MEAGVTGATWFVPAGFGVVKASDIARCSRVDGAEGLCGMPINEHNPLGLVKVTKKRGATFAQRAQISGSTTLSNRI